jgi:hypothetical protein
MASLRNLAFVTCGNWHAAEDAVANTRRGTALTRSSRPASGPRGAGGWAGQQPERPPSW